MINYKHLHYFWAVAREGGVARAGERLHLTPQTISGQLSLLEDYLGTALFTRAGRNLELTETGRLVLSYADEIFSLGGELEEVIHQLPTGRPQLFRVGVVDVLPKSITHRILQPALQMPEPVRMVCREATLDTLLAELAVHRLDLVLADRPIPPNGQHPGFQSKARRVRGRLLCHRETGDTAKRRFPPLSGWGTTAVAQQRQSAALRH